jgi:hypothetical protein
VYDGFASGCAVVAPGVATVLLAIGPSDGPPVAYLGLHPETVQDVIGQLQEAVALAAEHHLPD